MDLGIIVGSVREGRQGERVGRWVERAAAAREGVRVAWVDLKEWQFPAYRHSSPAKAAEKAYADPHERAFVELIGAQDAFIIVTPEYNHGYPASLKNALDTVYAGWNRKPVAFVSYGGTSGGTRAVQQLRQVVIELQMAPLREEVNIPFVGRALDERGDPKDEVPKKRLVTLLDDLTWWSKTLKAGRG